MDQIVAATRNMADVVVARTNLRLQAAVLVLSVAVIALTVVQLVVALND
jgi:acetamidase/formamidase